MKVKIVRELNSESLLAEDYIYPGRHRHTIRAIAKATTRVRIYEAKLAKAKKELYKLLEEER